MDRDELVDKAFHYNVMTVRDVARLLQVAPQLIYYRIRTGKLTQHTCKSCGREGLITVDDAIGTFSHPPQDVQAQVEAHGLDLESGDTEAESWKGMPTGRLPALEGDVRGV